MVISVSIYTVSVSLYTQVKWYVALWWSFLFQCAGTLASTFPLPDPTDLLGASHIRFEELRSDLLRLTTDLEGTYKSQLTVQQAVTKEKINMYMCVCIDATVLFPSDLPSVCRKRAKCVVDASSPDLLQPFRSRMEGFLEQGAAVIVVL